MKDPRRFVIGDCLGRGGFGEVYVAQLHQPGGLQTQVAVKVLHQHETLAPGSDAVRRLRDEGRILARLAHPTLLTVLDLTVLDGRIALVTEYVEGADLADCIHASPPLSTRGALQVIGQVAAALAVAHRAVGSDGAPLGLVHRDVKPTNIRIGQHGQVKLLDFGIAYSQDALREARTDSDLVVGSLHYMAPERFRSRASEPAWDVFGLGAVLYEALAQRRFLPDGLREIARLAMSASRYDPHLAARLDDLATQVPVDVADLLGDLLAFDPAARPTAAEVERRCEALVDAVPGDTLKRWCRSFPWDTRPVGEGPLRGRTLTEDSLGLPRDALDLGAPKLVQFAPPTLEPGGPEPLEPAPLLSRRVPRIESRLEDAPTEEQPAWAEPPTVEVDTPAPTPRAPPPRAPLAGTTWAFFAGGVLLAFAAVLTLIGAMMLVLWVVLLGTT